MLNTIEVNEEIDFGMPHSRGITVTHNQINKLIPPTGDEDAVQDAWVTLLSEVIETEEQAKLMLKRLEYRNENHRRSDRNRSAVLHDVEAEQDDTLSQSVRAGLHRLTEEHRDILTAVYMDGEPRHVVASRLGVSLPTFRRKLFLAKEAAKKSLADLSL